MKRLKLNMFWKTFISITFILLAITVIAYVLLYCLLPYYYKEYKTNQFENYANQLIENLETSDISEEYKILTNFANEYYVSIIVREKDIDGNIIYDLTQTSSIAIEEEIIGSGNEELEWNEQANIQTNNSDSLNLIYKYNIKSQLRYLEIDVPLQPLNEAKDVIINIYPIAVLVCIILSLAFSCVFSYMYVRPIKKIRSATLEMTKLSPDVSIGVSSHDEIGELSHDINMLYQELKGTIDTLKIEIDKYTNSENKKLDFLRTVSHELKNPLASANALIEGIIYDVPPYNQNQKQYLMECKNFLEKAIDLTKESLNLSRYEYKEDECEKNLKDIVADVVRDYKVIIKSKQIIYSENISDNIKIITKINLFSKVLANIFSNAANYTDRYGKIETFTETDCDTIKLIITNTCKPLTSDELSRLFVPFNNLNNKSNNSNGLGLYIVKQLLLILHMRYEFVPTDGGNGMKFIIHLGSFSNFA